MEGKLFDSEIKIMNVIWKRGSVTAKEIAEEMKNQVGWSKTTTYTLIRRCINKGAIERSEPNFVCRPLVSKENIGLMEANDLIDKLYDGISDQLIASLLSQKKAISPEKYERLSKLISDLEDK